MMANLEVKEQPVLEDLTSSAPSQKTNPPAGILKNKFSLSKKYQQKSDLETQIIRAPADARVFNNDHKTYRSSKTFSLEQVVDPNPAQYLKFFLIKSFNEESIFKAIKYRLWSSRTQGGNEKLQKAFESCQDSRGHVFLVFSVNRSGSFCGLAKIQEGL